MLRHNCFIWGIGGSSHPNIESIIHVSFYSFFLMEDLIKLDRYHIITG